MDAKKYWYHLAIAFDQLGNAIAGGNPDSTISARIGYNVEHDGHWIWFMLQEIVDWTFRPIDGPEHCRQAYDADKNEVFYAAGKDWIKLVLIWIVVVFCIPLSIIIRLSKLFKKK